jgi:hypothetical protein
MRNYHHCRRDKESPFESFFVMFWPAIPKIIDDKLAHVVALSFLNNGQLFVSARHPIYGSFTLTEWDAGPVPIALVAFTVNV